MKTTSITAVLVSTLGLALAQQSTPPTGTDAPNPLHNIKATLPKLDQKTVQSANQQMQQAGITEICAQSLSRVAIDWQTATNSINALVLASTNTPVLPAAQAAQAAMQTESKILNSRAGSRIDAAGISAYENAGSAIGMSMGAVAQVRQIQGQPAAVGAAADKATLDLQTLRTAQFATFGACGASIGATIDATDAVKPPGVPGSHMKVLCTLPAAAAAPAAGGASSSAPGQQLQQLH